MREKTIFESPQNRVFLITGETQDWFIGRDLVMIDFESFLAAHLHEIGYDHVIFRGANSYNMKFALDEDSATYAFPSKGSSREARPGGSRGRRMPGGGLPRHRSSADTSKESAAVVGKEGESAAASGEAGKKEKWKNLTYGNARELSQEVLLGQFKDHMNARDCKNAVVFADLDAFFASDYYRNYMELLTRMVTLPTRSENIVIFIAPGYTLEKLESQFAARPEFARMFANMGKGEGTGMCFDSNRVLQVGMPGQDEFVRLLEHLRIVGIRDRVATGAADIKGNAEDFAAGFLRLNYRLKDLDRLASTLRFCCYDKALGSGGGDAGEGSSSATGNDGHKNLILNAEHEIADYMKTYKKTSGSLFGNKIPFDEQVIRYLFGGKKDYSVSALQELNRKGWESVYEVVKAVIKDNETRMNRAAAPGQNSVLARMLEETDADRISICERIQITTKQTRRVNIPHFMLLGPPGTGKTTVAALVGRALNEAGILSTGHTVSVKGSELISDHVGGTAHLVANKIEEARNGVLFIDEAYSMLGTGKEHGHDFAQAAVDTLVGYSGTEQQDAFPFCLIMAGYGDQLEPIFDMNPGLRSRMTYTLELKPYKPEHLAEIYLEHVAKQGLSVDERLVPVLPDFFRDLQDSVPEEDFANAREAIQIIGDELTIRNCNARGGNCIIQEDFGRQAGLFRFHDDSAEENAKRIQQEIEDVLATRIGNEDLKEVIRGLTDKVIYNMLYPERKTPVHPGYYFFVGSPGTGKSTSADILAKCLYILGLVSDEAVILQSAQSLVAGYVGQTHSKTVEELKKSRRRVLLLDEAYALRSDGHGFNSQAMTEMVAFLDQPENRKFSCIILAGYQEDMDALTRSGTGNTGLLSRLSSVIKFHDYSAKDCADMLVFMAQKGAPAYTVDDDVKDYYEQLFEIVREEPGFANGRTVRSVYEKMIDKAIRRINQNRYAGDDPLLTRLTMEDVLSPEEVRLLNRAVAKR
ncbi:MAG: AAA family ATPase [Lachnospiraceae bacterium]|nr:AAA family ATPase [Lachnospiraceae bacterium]